MLRIKIIKAHQKYKIGEIVSVSRNEAFGLLDSGVAKLTKDMTQADYRSKNGKSK